MDPALLQKTLKDRCGKLEYPTVIGFDDDLPSGATIVVEKLFSGEGEVKTGFLHQATFADCLGCSGFSLAPLP